MIVPTEILEIILSYADPKTICIMCYTSKIPHRIIEQSKIKYNPETLISYYNHNTIIHNIVKEEFKKIISNFCIYPSLFPVLAQLLLYTDTVKIDDTLEKIIQKSSIFNNVEDLCKIISNINNVNISYSKNIYYILYNIIRIIQPECLLNQD